MGVLAERFFSGVSAADYRYEQLGDYVTGRFEHYLSWTIAILVDLANALLEGREATQVRLCRELGSYIRYGVSSPMALWLVQRGLRSRCLAQVISAAAEEQGLETQSQLLGWLRHLGPAGWRDTFEAMPLDLRDLLEIARTQSASLLVDLLSHVPVSIAVVPTLGVREGGATLKQVRAGLEMAPVLSVQVAGAEAAVIGTEHHADIATFLEVGLPHTGQLALSGNQWELTLQLADL